ncbi:MAG: response regulator [Candidatus Omnitrophota bacterium]
MKEQRKILVIDDESDALELLKVRLESYGYIVLTALNAKQALELAKNRPDIILLDLLMPTEEEGLRIFSALKAEKMTQLVPIIFLTGKAEEGDRLIQLGARFFLEKPYEAEELLKRIDLALKRDSE